MFIHKSVIKRLYETEVVCSDRFCGAANGKNVDADLSKGKVLFNCCWPLVQHLLRNAEEDYRAGMESPVAVWDL